MRHLAGLLLAGTLAVGLASPAGAIETSEFGIEAQSPVTDSGGRPRFVAEVAAGRATSVAVRVWNKSDGAVTVALTVVPATVSPDGPASLEGDTEPVRWVSLAEEEIHLAPGEDRTLDVLVEGPRHLEDRPRTVAVVAQAADAGSSAGADSPAVLQRLALIAYLEPVAGGVPGLGLLPWVAGALALAVAGWAASARHRDGEAAPATALT